MYLKETLFWVRGLEQFGTIITFYNQIEGLLSDYNQIEGLLSEII